LPDVLADSKEQFPCQRCRIIYIFCEAYPVRVCGFLTCFSGTGCRPHLEAFSQNIEKATPDAAFAAHGAETAAKKHIANQNPQCYSVTR
jgi:hypothetical protein